MKRTWLVGGFLLALAGCASTGPGAAPPAPPVEARTIDPALAEATFDSAWSIIHRTFWDTTFNGVDWRATREELLPRARAAGTDAELRGVIQEMLDRLRKSQLVVIPGDAAEALAAEQPSGPPAHPGEAGLELRWVEDSLLVTRVLPGGAADAAGVRPGWLVESAGEMTVARIRTVLARLPASADPRRLATYASASMEAALQASVGDTVRARFRDGSGALRDVPLVLRRTPGRLATFGNLPPILARVETERVSANGLTVGVIRFPIWLPAVAGELDQAVHGLRDADGIVVDLRGNPGGLGAMAPGFAGHFVDRRDTLGTMITRRDTVPLVINPRRVSPAGRPVAPFGGPVAVLVDERTASTSEVFAGGMQALGRARVFGTTSAGQALASLTPRLANGDVLLHAIAAFVGPDGERWEGAGVVPDVQAPPSRAALLAGRDAAFESAVAWIRSEAGRALP